MALTSHTKVKIMWITHTASLGGASVTVRLSSKEVSVTSFFMWCCIVLTTYNQIFFWLFAAWASPGQSDLQSAFPKQLLACTSRPIKGEEKLTTDNQRNFGNVEPINSEVVKTTVFINNKCIDLYIYNTTDGFFQVR